MLCRVAIVASLILAAPVSAPEFPVLVGKVSRIVNCDTIEVKLDSGPIRVRLHGIDTSERGQAWFTEAQIALAGLILSETVDLEPFEHLSANDRS